MGGGRAQAVQTYQFGLLCLLSRGLHQPQSCKLSPAYVGCRYRTFPPNLARQPRLSQATLVPPALFHLFGRGNSFKHAALSLPPVGRRRFDW